MAASGAGRPARIFIVEDHGDLRQILDIFVGSLEGFVVVGQSTTAEDALARICTGDPHAVLPDAVLIDVSLPGMDGIELAGRIRERVPDLPCVMLSAHRAGNYPERSRAAGARAYVEKDDIDALPDVLRRVLGGEPLIDGS